MPSIQAKCPKCGKGCCLVLKREAKLDWNSKLPSNPELNDIPDVLREGKKILDASRKGELREIPVERFMVICTCGFQGWTDWDSTKT